MRAWRYLVKGVTGFQVPVYLLDTDLPENGPEDRKLTDVLYGGDSAYRLSQEVVLGIGGVRLLHVLGYHQIARFHMNEGHAALLVLALFEEQLAAMVPEATGWPSWGVTSCDETGGGSNSGGCVSNCVVFCATSWSRGALRPWCSWYRAISCLPPQASWKSPPAV
jgi:hypothetical protein